jgi:uroporphyrinogen decarboxylase
MPPAEAERTPVWLMRQAGRYMAEFREYSDKYPFRMRSETPEIAIELSMQVRAASRQILCRFWAASGQILGSF